MSGKKRPKVENPYSTLIKSAEELGNSFFQWLEEDQNEKELYTTKSLERVSNRIDVIKRFLLSNHQEKNITDGFSKSQLQLLWLLWKDKSFAREISPEKPNKLRNKVDLNKDTRRRIHAGLLIAFIQNFQSKSRSIELSTDKIATAFVQIGFNKVDYSKELVGDYVKAKNAIKHHYENQPQDSIHKVVDTVLAGFYGICSGIMKGTASIVVLLSFGLLPANWVAIPVFAFFFAVLNLNFLGKSWTNNLMRAGASVALFAVITAGVLLAPSMLWFIGATMLLLGAVAGLQSYRMLNNIYTKSRAKSKHGGLIKELFYKTDEHGHQVAFNPREKAVIWGIAIPFSFTGSAVFTFIGYQGLMYFISSLPILAGLAAWPATPFLVFAFITAMQLTSSITCFRFTRNQYLKFANMSFAEVKNKISDSVRGYFRSWVQEPFKTFGKSFVALVLVAIAALYMLVGAHVSSVSFMIFFGIKLTGISRAIGLVAGICLTIPIQLLFSYNSNSRLHGAIISTCDSIKNYFKRKPKDKELSQEELHQEQIMKDLEVSEHALHGFHKMRSTSNMILNVLGKSSLKMNPHLPTESIPNMVVEAINALAFGMLSLKESKPDDEVRKDLLQLSFLSKFSQPVEDSCEELDEEQTIAASQTA